MNMKWLTTDDNPPEYEETFEQLPSYSCTVYKQGYVKIKKEASAGGTREIKLIWSTFYFILRGTVLEIFKNESDTQPIRKLSMLQSQCGMASGSRYNVLRVKFGTREQFLLKPVGGITEVISWFEHIQSAANISTDIDKRRMPKILTIARGNTPLQEELRQTRTLTLVAGKTQAVVPILRCQFDV